MTLARPVLRYPGGKYLIADWIVSHFPAHNLYVEPFGGAASVLLAKPRSKGEIYNDIDGDVVNVFRILRDRQQADELERILRLTPFALDEYRNAFEPIDDPMEKARRMIFRSFAGIGSDSIFVSRGFRYSKHNKSGVVPAQAWSRYPDAISQFTDRLQGVVVNNSNAFDVIRKYDAETTLFYIDPPYLRATRTADSVKYMYEFADNYDHRRLAELLHVIKGMSVLSGYASELYQELYGDWRCISHTAKAHQGAKRTECIWLSPNIKTTLF